MLCPLFCFVCLFFKCSLIAPLLCLGLCEVYLFFVGHSHPLTYSYSFLKIIKLQPLSSGCCPLLSDVSLWLADNSYSPVEMCYTCKQEIKGFGNVFFGASCCPLLMLCLLKLSLSFSKDRALQDSGTNLCKHCSVKYSSRRLDFQLSFWELLDPQLPCTYTGYAVLFEMWSHIGS